MRTPLTSVHWSIRAGVALAIALASILGVIAAGRTWFSPDQEELWKRAVADMQAGHWQDAWAGLDRLARLRPATPREWALRAEIAEAEGDTTWALEALRHVPEDDRLAPEALYMTGLIERRNNRLRYAEAAYRRALARNPALIKARKELIYILGMQFRRREVDAEFKALSGMTPLNHHDLFVWCLTHFIVWGPDSAENLQAFIQADPDDRYSRLALATLLISQPGQEAKVEDLLKSMPRDAPEALAMRVELKLNHGQTDEAMAMLSESGENTPHLARLRGRMALQRGDFEAASRHFRSALSDEPYDRVSISELGKALLLKGDREAAESYLTRARQLDEVYRLVNRVSKSDQPNQALDLNQLGKACEGAGLLDEAKGWYQLAIGLNPLDADAQRALHRLRDVARPSIPARAGHD
ncbi:MAG: tetratricopeptide repeat protein [Isosphaeraceae bacterium]